MSKANRSQVMWAQSNVFGLFSVSVGSFSDNLGSYAILVIAERHGVKAGSMPLRHLVPSRYNRHAPRSGLHALPSDGWCTRRVRAWATLSVAGDRGFGPKRSRRRPTLPARDLASSDRHGNH